jgi:hypothetical protein
LQPSARRRLRSSDQQTFKLGEPGGGDAAICEYGDKGEQGRGIYRYDADTQEHTSLVEGGIPLFIQGGDSQINQTAPST